MAIAAGHFYWSGSDSPVILLCTDAVGFEFQRLPDGAVQKYAANPTLQFTDLQTMGLVAPFPTCTLDGEPMQIVEAYSTDATTPNIKCVMLRPQVGYGPHEQGGGGQWIVVPRSQIGNILPAGAV